MSAISLLDGNMSYYDDKYYYRLILAKNKKCLNNIWTGNRNRPFLCKNKNKDID